ncbi:MAG TPA: hypothetical protein VF220_08705 [Nitrososphaeraceae archaeon]
MNQKNNDNIVKKIKTQITREPIIAASVIASMTLLVTKTGKVIRKCG